MKLALILVLSGLLTQPLFANSSDESKKRSKMSSSHYDSILSSIEANDINSLKDSLDAFNKDFEVHTDNYYHHEFNINHLARVAFSKESAVRDSIKEYLLVNMITNFIDNADEKDVTQNYRTVNDINSYIAEFLISGKNGTVESILNKTNLKDLSELQRIQNSHKKDNYFTDKDWARISLIGHLIQKLAGVKNKNLSITSPDSNFHIFQFLKNQFNFKDNESNYTLNLAEEALKRMSDKSTSNYANEALKEFLIILASENREVFKELDYQEITDHADTDKGLWVLTSPIFDAKININPQTSKVSNAKVALFLSRFGNIKRSDEISFFNKVLENALKVNTVKGVSENNVLDILKLHRGPLSNKILALLKNKETDSEKFKIISKFGVLIDKYVTREISYMKAYELFKSEILEKSKNMDEDFISLLNEVFATRFTETLIEDGSLQRTLSCLSPESQNLSSMIHELNELLTDDLSYKVEHPQLGSLELKFHPNHSTIKSLISEICHEDDDTGVSYINEDRSIKSKLHNSSVLIQDKLSNTNRSEAYIY